MAPQGAYVRDTPHCSSPPPVLLKVPGIEGRKVIVLLVFCGYLGVEDPVRKCKSSMLVNKAAVRGDPADTWEVMKLIK
jgi:hypothetical protein